YPVAFRPPDGRRLAAGNDGDVMVWDWNSNKHPPLHTFSGYGRLSIPVAFSPDGRRLATGGAGQQGQRLWDVETGELLHTLPGHRSPVSALALSPDGGRLASASLDRRRHLHATTTRRLLRP